MIGLRMLPFQFGAIIVQVDGKLHPHWCVLVDADGVPTNIYFGDARDPILTLEEEAAERYRDGRRPFVRVQLHPVTIRDILNKWPAWGDAP